MWNRTDYRPLEGFVYAITPFNFTAIAGNLPTAPALMGNTVVWKPSPTQTFAAYLTMQLLEAAGLPPGVINLVTGDGFAVSDVALADPRLAGIHFTGSTADVPAPVARGRHQYRPLPQLPAAGRRDRRQGLRRRPLLGAPGCAAHRADSRRVRLPGPEVLGRVAGVRPALGVAADGRRLPVGATEALRYGDVTDLTNFGGAVIDERVVRQERQGDRARQERPGVTVAAGGEYDDSEGYFVRPTVLLSDDPTDEAFRTEYFGPILAVHVYPDDGLRPHPRRRRHAVPRTR